MIKILDIKCKVCDWEGEIFGRDRKVSAPHVNTRGCANAGGEVR